MHDAASTYLLVPTAATALGTYMTVMNVMSRAASRHPSVAMEAVWSNSATDMNGAACAIM